MRRRIIVGGMALLLVLGCNNGIAELEKKNSFYESVIKIGQGFQEIFGIFGNALRFNAVKSTDNRSAVGGHFEKIKKGLTETDHKLKELSGKIFEAKNADGSTIENVKNAIKGANDVFEKLISALTKLISAAGNTDIGDNVTADAVPANDVDVKIVIDNVKEIIALAEQSDVKVVEKGNDGGVGASALASTATATLGGVTAGQGAGPKFAEEVSKADPWAMIDKIKNATVNKAQLNAGTSNDAGALATGANASGNNGAKAATNADLAAAVALKAMTKNGKFSANVNDVGAVKAAAASAVNKVLGVLDEIIRRTVSSHLDKVREAVKGIQYSETTGESTEAKK